MHTIRPWLVRIEQAMNRALFPDKEKGVYYVQFNLDGLMRGDYKSRMEGYAIGRQNGWLSTNDIRELENMNPVSEEEGGDVLLVNGNMLPVKFVLQKAEALEQINNVLMEAPPDEPPQEQDDTQIDETPDEDGKEDDA